jgi:ABC-type glycerol-3-phosphate transport system permease component
MTILEMIHTVITNTMGLLQQLFQLFYKLLVSLGFVSVVGGTAGVLLSVIILALVGYFLAKFVIGTGKGILLLFLVGLALAVVVMLLVF